MHSGVIFPNLGLEKCSFAVAEFAWSSALEEPSRVEEQSLPHPGRCPGG